MISMTRQINVPGLIRFKLVVSVKRIEIKLKSLIASLR